MDDALAVVEHISNRVAASAFTGLGCGAAYSTYRGLPVARSSLSTAFSFAMISTACFGMERVASAVLGRSSRLIDGAEPIEEGGRPADDGIAALSALRPTINPALHYGSHAVGGLCGGGLVGFLFQGRPVAGAFLMTPIMLCIGRIEVALDEYRVMRLKQIMEEGDSA